MTSLNKYFTLKITKDKRKLQKYRAKDLGEVHCKRKRKTIMWRVGRGYIYFSENLFVFKMKFWTAKEIFIFV